MAKPANGQSRKTGRKNRKHGRNKRAPCNAMYKTENRRMINKLRKLVKYTEKNPKDTQSKSALTRLSSEFPLELKYAQKRREFAEKQNR